MNTEEMIEFLKERNKYKLYRNSALNITQLNKVMDNVIELLQQKIIEEVVEGITEQIKEGTEIAKKEAEIKNG